MVGWSVRRVPKMQFQTDVALLITNGQTKISGISHLYGFPLRQTCVWVWRHTHTQSNALVARTPLRSSFFKRCVENRIYVLVETWKLCFWSSDEVIVEGYTLTSNYSFICKFITCFNTPFRVKCFCRPDVNTIRKFFGSYSHSEIYHITPMISHHHHHT